MSVNYSHITERILKSVEDHPPRLLLHSCCAVCSSYVLDYLSPFFSLDVLYYNPNIYPKEEYQLRKAEQQRLIRETRYQNPVSYLDGDYDYRAFLSAAKGLETQPEGGSRCRACFQLRLERTAQFAAEGRYDYFATTLTISPHKSAVTINEIGEALASRFGVAWLFADFKKKGGFQRANELAKEKEIYRQNYCGCAFSQGKEKS